MSSGGDFLQLKTAKSFYIVASVNVVIPIAVVVVVVAAVLAAIVVAVAVVTVAVVIVQVLVGPEALLD